MSDQGEADRRGVDLNVQWPKVVPSAQIINQFSGQIGAGPAGLPEEVILTVGHVAPPILWGNEEQQVEQAREQTSLEIQAVSRFTMTPARARELLNVLQGTLEVYNMITADLEGRQE